MNQLWQFSMSHWQLVMSLLLILLVILGFEIKAKADGAPSLSPLMAVEWINRREAVVIDIRDTEAFRKGHVVHSQSMSPTEAVDIITRESAKYKNKPVIVICAQGLQAQKTATALKGIVEVAILKGGINSWISAELPLEKSK